MALTSDIDRIIMLMEEIAYAESQLQPHDTGHINTAIGWMQKSCSKNSYSQICNVS